MKIVITGASGNIGRKLFSELNEKHQATVIGLSRMHHEGLEMTDYGVESLVNIFQNADLVIHLASHRGVADDYQTFAENEIITENILKAMLAAGVHRIIFMSSIAVYSNEAMPPWKEDQYPVPQSFYGLSKLMCEYLCRQYSTKGIDYTILRCGIVYGGDHSKRMISSFIDKATAKDTLVLRGKSIAKRDFIYVKDVVSALLWSIYEAPQKNQIYNLGSGAPLTNLEVALTVNGCMDNSGNLIYEESVRENVTDSYMDISKITGAGFRCSFTFQSALYDIKDKERMMRK